MATDTFDLRQYFREIDCRTCYINLTSPACPVIINFADASAKSISFPDAVVQYYLDAGIPLHYFFSTATNHLFSYVKGKTTEKSEAIKRLEDFLRSDEHRNCLLTLKDNTYNESEIKVILAAHLFGPLAGSYRIGNHCFPAAGKKCRGCNLDVSGYIQDTSFGNENVWHGYADLFVKRSVVMMTSKEDEDVGSGEPLQKKRRTGKSGNDEGFRSDDSVDSVVEVKKNKDLCSDATSQGLAQTIVNAYCEAKVTPSLSGSFIPSFIASRSDITMAMYNVDLDILIMTQEFMIFCNKGTRTTLDIATILFIWYTLNFDVFFKAYDPFFRVYKKSNFRDQTGAKLSIYENSCTKPMTTKENQNPIRFCTTLDFNFDSEMLKVVNETAKEYI